MADAIIGGIVGAFVGSVLGYLFSYHLGRLQRKQEVEERRKRLLRALSHEISAMPPQGNPYSAANTEIFTGTHLATLDPLLDLSADLDEGLVSRLAVLKAAIHQYNDLIGTVNQVAITTP